jgi:hypothetical protein
MSKAGEMVWPSFLRFLNVTAGLIIFKPCTNHAGPPCLDHSGFMIPQIRECFEKNMTTPEFMNLCGHVLTMTCLI